MTLLELPSKVSQDIVARKFIEVPKLAIPKHASQSPWLPMSKRSPLKSCASHATLMRLTECFESSAGKSNRASLDATVLFPAAPRGRGGLRKCWGDEGGSSASGIAPLQPLPPSRRSASATKPAVGRHRCLVCQSTGKVVRKAFGGLWLCTGCITDEQMSPLKTRRQPLDVRPLARGMAHSFSAPGLREKTSSLGLGRKCKLCYKPFTSSACASESLCRACFALGEFQDTHSPPTARFLLDELLVPACVVDGCPPEFII